ncbi:hypothetical protein [Sphingomonas sp.]|uniref:hypothetical protein n=1 Tax=Sphingomonas sp. TaxID=28214 RepID=UPI00333FBD17
MLAMLMMMTTAAALPAPCIKLRQPIGPVVRAAEAKRLTRDARQQIKPDGVTLILADGPWRLVWATPAEAERGVYFYRRTAKGGYRLIDTWGGVIAPEERTETVAWAQARGGHPPQRIAGCFADAVLAGY